MIGPAPGMRPTRPRSTLHRRRTATKISGTMGDQKKEPNLPSAEGGGLADLRALVAGEIQRGDARDGAAEERPDQEQHDAAAREEGQFLEGHGARGRFAEGGEVRGALLRQNAEHAPDGGAGRREPGRREQREHELVRAGPPVAGRHEQGEHDEDRDVRAEGPQDDLARVERNAKAAEDVEPVLPVLTHGRLPPERTSPKGVPARLPEYSGAGRGMSSRVAGTAWTGSQDREDAEL